MSIGNYTPNGKGHPIKLDNERTIGEIDGDTFVKSVCESRHMLKCPRAWAIQAEPFDEQVKPFVKWLVIEGKETGKRWKTSIEYFDTYKKSMDRGFGLQYYLVLSRWQIVEPNGNGSHQLGLWGDE